MIDHRTSILIICTASMTVAPMGCTTPGHPLPRTEDGLIRTATVPAHPWAPTGLPMFEGDTGLVATWSDLMQGVAGADVVVLGEEHDDEVAHRFQLAVVEQTLASWPDTAIALEMLERDEQAAVDAYLTGTIDRDALLDAVTSSEGARSRFVEFYLPIVDAAARKGAAVVAANAPRRFVTMGRVEGWETLARRSETDRALYVIPSSIHQGAYRRRLEALMQEHDNDVDPDRVDSVLRAQQIWDATMADSTLNAYHDAGKVILLVGRFHGDFAGGTIEVIHDRNPLVDVFYASTINEDRRALQEADRDRADLVIYTGGAPRGSDPIDPMDDTPEEADS